MSLNAQEAAGATQANGLGVALEERLKYRWETPRNSVDTAVLRGVDLADRFWRDVEHGTPEDCWPWRGAKNNHGYGYFGWDGGRLWAHRTAIEVSSGKTIPKGLCACHHCDNPSCCNPSHLYIGNARENGLDAWSRSRKATSSPCQKRGCGLLALMGRMGKFCGNAHKAWVLDHPEDDLRKEHFCLRRKGTRRALDRRLSRQGLLLLGRLQKGPASNLELVQAGAGFRYSARIHEARELGHDIRLIEQDHATGRTVYALFIEGEMVK